MLQYLIASIYVTVAPEICIDRMYWERFESEEKKAQTL